MSLFKYTIVLLFSIILLGCSGGKNSSTNNSSNSNDNNDTNVTSVVELKDNVIVIDENSTSSVKTLSVKENGDTVISLPKKYLTQVKKGKILTMPIGENKNYPLGFSAKIVEVTDKNITLAPVILQEVVNKIKMNKISKKLSEAKLVGIIEPNFSNESNNSKNRLINYRYTPISLNKNYYFNDIPLNVEFPFKKIADQRTNTTVDYNGTGNLSIKLNATDITIHSFIDFKTSSISNSAFDFFVSGTFNESINLTGNASLVLGRFNHAWNETKKASYNKLGVSLKLLGLNPKVDKVGKMPIIGYVYTITGESAIYGPGKTQTPIRLAKKGGIIVWINLLAKGKLDINGSLGASYTKPFKIGIFKKKNGNVYAYPNKYKPKTTLSLRGAVTDELHLGVSLDVDFFLAGIRFANSDITGKVIAKTSLNSLNNTTWEIDSKNKIGLKHFGSPACVSGRLGAGIIFSNSIRLAYEAKVFNFWEKSDNFERRKQIPSNSKINNATIGWNGTWYNAYNGKKCYGLNVNFKSEPSKLRDFELNNIEVKTDDNTILTPEELSYILYDNSGKKIRESNNLQELTSLLKAGKYKIEVILYIDKEKGIETSISHQYIVSSQPNNTPPVANAGEDFKTPEHSIVLDGSGSYDKDGKIVSYIWKENNKTVGEGEAITLEDVTDGVHIYTLTVKDNKGLTDSDDIIVTVGAIVNNKTVLKKTGQTKSYDTQGKEVTDGSLKDDGYYQKGVEPKYSRDDAKEVVTDYITGLMWQDNEEAKTLKKPWLTEEHYNICSGIEGEIQNTRKCFDTSGDTAESYCKNLNLGGYNDWRLPTIEELITIIDYSKSNPAMDNVFQYIANSSYGYWSSTNYFLGGVGLEGTDAYYIHPNSGFVLMNDKLDKRNVRCVRTITK